MSTLHTLVRLQEFALGIRLRPECATGFLRDLDSLGCQRNAPDPPEISRFAECLALVDSVALFVIANRGKQLEPYPAKAVTSQSPYLHRRV